MLRRQNTILYAAQCTLFIGLAVLSWCLCTDAATSVQLVVSLCAAYAIPYVTYSRLRSHTMSGQYILLAATALLGIGIVLNVYEYTSVMHGTLQQPILINNDAQRYYHQALDLYHGNTSDIPYNIYAMPAIACALWHLFGISIVYPLAFNMMLVLFSLILSGILSERLLCGFVTRFDAPAINTLAMALTASVCYYISRGALLLKEPVIYVAVLLMSIGLCSVYRSTPPSNTLSWKNIALFSVGAFIIAFARQTLVFFIIMAIPILGFDKIKFQWRNIAFMLIVSIAAYSIGNVVSNYSTQSHEQIVTGSPVMETQYLNLERHKSYNALIHNYYEQPLIVRFALVPISAAVQFVIPFPWNFGRDTPFGYSEAYAHISYPWYVIGGIILFFYIFLWFSKKGSPLRLWALWALMCYLVPAYLYAGSVSRYILPFIPLMIPLAIMVIAELRENRYHRLFKYYSIAYITILSIGLAACYFIQSGRDVA